MENVPSLLAGTALTLAIYLAVSIMSGGTFEDPWLAPALMINGSFSMIFGAVGLQLAWLFVLDDGRAA